MRIRVALGASLALVLIASGCSSSSGDDESGEVTINNILNETASGGTFTATGSAICDAGQVFTLNFEISETAWWYEDRYTCADGSGAFLLRGELPPIDPDGEGDPEPRDGTWTILNGTGDYLNLEGGGTSHVDFDPAWVESYVGEVSTG